MNIARENELIVTDMSEVEGGALDDEAVERLSRIYTLHIFNENDAKTIPLKFPGTQTVLEVKTDVYAITNIAVRHQNWTGWPTNTSNDKMIALSGILTEHNFVLKSMGINSLENREPTRSTSGTSHGNQDRSTSRASSNAAISNTIEIDSDSSVDEFEDASDFNGDDEIFTSSVTRNRLKHLSKFIPSHTSTIG